MPALDRLPPDALTIAFLEPGRDDALPDGWVHLKLAPATIIAIACRGRYEVHFERGSPETAVAAEGEAFLARDREALRIVHRGRRRGEPMHACWLHASFTLFRTIDVVSLLDLPAKLDARAAAGFLEIVEELERLPPEGSLARAARKLELGFRALGLLAARAPLNASATPLLQNVERLAKVLAFINDHLAEVLTVDELAREAHLSRSRFFAFFHENLKCSPMDYVKQVRLAEARKRLIASDDKLAVIAEATGFTNPFHLSREFKRQVGVPPGEFRKQQRSLVV